MTLSFRPLSINDLVPLWDLLMRYRDRYATDNTYPTMENFLTLADDRTPLRSFLQKSGKSAQESEILLNTPSSYSVTILRDEKPVGIASFEDVVPGLGARLHFIIEPSQTFAALKQGTLEAILLDRMKAMGVPLVRLAIFEHQRQAMKLAQKVGFEYTGRCRNVDILNGKPISISLFEITPDAIQAHLAAGGGAVCNKRKVLNEIAQEDNHTKPALDTKLITEVAQQAVREAVEKHKKTESTKVVRMELPGMDDIEEIA